MRRLLPLLALPWLAGCVVYPRVYNTKIAGKAVVEPGKTARIEVELIKECATLRSGETQRIVKKKSTSTDAEGNYSMRLRAVVAHFKSFTSPAECESRIQQYICRPVDPPAQTEPVVPDAPPPPPPPKEHCLPVDQVDIEVLGK